MVRFGFSGIAPVGFAAPVLAFSLLLNPGSAGAQGQALPSVKVNLPPTPNFDIATAPLTYPTGEMSVYGLRKATSKYLDKDVRVKGFLLQLYECPAELRKCNDDAAAQAKKASRANKKAAAKGAEPEPAAPAGGCRPCDQPHFFIGDTATTKVERGLLVADYPIKDWETGKPKPLVAKAGDPFVVTGTFSINSMTGFAASNGLLIHKRTQTADGKTLAEGNAVLPPEAQTIQLDGKPPEPLLPAKQAGAKK